MQRVHRNLSRDEVEALRRELADLVPEARSNIAPLLRKMRLITRKSQSEYARLCGVAPRVLADIESGKGSPTVDTLEKLLRPFGYRVGVVAPPIDV
jgi:XRE family transcriptional regulator, regulator of sulfur utilization